LQTEIDRYFLNTLDLFSLNQNLYLASNSPRRKELLESLGIPFNIIKKNFKENIIFSGDPADFVKKLSVQKSVEITGEVDEGLVITADTIVYINREILEKPVNNNDARSMLKKLSGNTHEVFTGVSVSVFPGAVIKTGYERTEVTFKELTDDEIYGYISTGEHSDKAGAYAIQGKGSVMIKKVNGCYFNVVGLPLNLLNYLISTI